MRKHPRSVRVAGIPLIGVLVTALVSGAAAAAPRESDWESANLEIAAAAQRGDAAGVLRAAEHALVVAREAFGPRHMKTAVALKKLAEAQRLAGRHRDSAATLAEAGGVWSASLGKDHPYVSDLGLRAAEDLVAAGDSDAAVRALDEVVDSRRRFYGPNHTATATALQARARIKRNAGQGREALEDERAAAQILYTVLDPAHSRVLRAGAELARRLWESGDSSAARSELKSLLDRASSSSRIPLKDLADVWILSGDVAAAERDTVAAEASYAAAHDLLERAADTAAPHDRLQLLYRQREFYESIGRSADAARASEAARAIELAAEGLRPESS